MNPLDIQQQLADQRRGRYVRVSDVDRRLLIDTYKKGEDFIALAKKLNIKRSTGKNIKAKVSLVHILGDSFVTYVFPMTHESWVMSKITSDFIVTYYFYL